MSSFGTRLSQAFQSKGQLCVGIDPSFEQLESWNLPQSAEGARTFAMALLDAAAVQVALVKPQVAYFEQFGAEGFKILAEVMQEASSRELMVIADAKRGDIGSTMTGYANAWLSQEAVFACDALTVSPYLGPESLNETVLTALDNNRGLFVLSATSNPEASGLQAAITAGSSVAKSVYDYAKTHCTGEVGSIGVVIGATVECSTLGIDTSEVSNVPVLVPGFGSQGVELSSAATVLGSLASVSICSVSRSIAGATREGLSQRLAAAKSELEIGLRA